MWISYPVAPSIGPATSRRQAESVMTEHWSRLVGTTPSPHSLSVYGKEQLGHFTKLLFFCVCFTKKWSQTEWCDWVNDDRVVLTYSFTRPSFSACLSGFQWRFSLGCWRSSLPPSISIQTSLASKSRLVTLKSGSGNMTAVDKPFSSHQCVCVCVCVCFVVISHESSVWMQSHGCPSQSLASHIQWLNMENISICTQWSHVQKSSNFHLWSVYGSDLQC